MKNFDLKQYLTENTLMQELAVERALLQNYFYEFLKGFENNLDGKENIMNNELALELQKHLDKYDAVDNIKDLPNIVRNDAEEFDKLFTILAQTYTFPTKVSNMTDRFITFLDRKVN